MEICGVDGVVLSDQTNIEYFLGYFTLTWQYKSRPLFAYISKKDAVLIAAKTEKRNLDQERRVFDVSFYDGFLEEASCCVANEVKARHENDHIVIALDHGQDFFGRGSLTLTASLERLSASTELRSAEDVIWPVRMISSPFEVALKREAFFIVNNAFDQVISEAGIGISELELYRKIQAKFFELGADSAPPIAMSFGKGDIVYNRPPTERRLTEGDYVWTDFRATVGRYPADRNRIARAGHPNSEEIELYSKVRHITVELCKSIRPGEMTGDVFERYLALWKQQNLPPPYKYLNRIGHGGGRDVTEPPSISRNGTENIQAGMILHLEPKLEFGNAVFQFEEIVHVGKNQNDFLSALSPERVPVIL